MNRITGSSSSELQYNFIDIHTLTEENIEQTLALMAEKKRARVYRFSNSDDRLRSIAAEYLARIMLSARLNLSSEHIHFGSFDGGKPFVINLPCHISLSHSASLAMCAVSNHPVGADIELIGERGQKLIPRVCTPQEAEYITTDGIYDPVRFYKVWTAKEAILKRSGRGLSGGFSSLSTADVHGMHSIIDDIPLISGVYEGAAYAVYG